MTKKPNTTTDAKASPFSRSVLACMVAACFSLNVAATPQETFESNGAVELNPINTADPVTLTYEKGSLTIQGAADGKLTANKVNENDNEEKAFFSYENNLTTTGGIFNASATYTPGNLTIVERGPAGETEQQANGSWKVAVLSHALNQAGEKNKNIVFGADENNIKLKSSIDKLQAEELLLDGIIGDVDNGANVVVQIDKVLKVDVVGKINEHEKGIYALSGLDRIELAGSKDGTLDVNVTLNSTDKSKGSYGAMALEQLQGEFAGTSKLNVQSDKGVAVGIDQRNGKLTLGKTSVTVGGNPATAIGVLLGELPAEYQENEAEDQDGAPKAASLTLNGDSSITVATNGTDKSNAVGLYLNGEQTKFTTTGGLTINSTGHAIKGDGELTVNDGLKVESGSVDEFSGTFTQTGDEVKLGDNSGFFSGDVRIKGGSLKVGTLDLKGSRVVELSGEGKLEIAQGFSTGENTFTVVAPYTASSTSLSGKANGAFYADSSGGFLFSGGTVEDLSAKLSGEIINAYALEQRVDLPLYSALQFSNKTTLNGDKLEIEVDGRTASEANDEYDLTALNIKGTEDIGVVFNVPVKITAQGGVQDLTSGVNGESDLRDGEDNWTSRPGSLVTFNKKVTLDVSGIGNAVEGINTVQMTTAADAPLTIKSTLERSETSEKTDFPAQAIGIASAFGKVNGSLDVASKAVNGDALGILLRHDAVEQFDSLDLKGSSTITASSEGGSAYGISLNANDEKTGVNTAQAVVLNIGGEAKVTASGNGDSSALVIAKDTVGGKVFDATVNVAEGSTLKLSAPGAHAITGDGALNVKGALVIENGTLDGFTGKYTQVGSDLVLNEEVKFFGGDVSVEKGSITSEFGDLKGDRSISLDEQSCLNFNNGLNSNGSLITIQSGGQKASYLGSAEGRIAITGLAQRDNVNAFFVAGQGFKTKGDAFKITASFTKDMPAAEGDEGHRPAVLTFEQKENPGAFELAAASHEVTVHAGVEGLEGADIHAVMGDADAHTMPTVRLAGNLDVKVNAEGAPSGESPFVGLNGLSKFNIEQASGTTNVTVTSSSSGTMATALNQLTGSLGGNSILKASNVHGDSVGVYQGMLGEDENALVLHNSTINAVSADGNAFGIVIGKAPMGETVKESADATVTLSGNSSVTVSDKGTALHVSNADDQKATLNIAPSSSVKVNAPQGKAIAGDGLLNVSGDFGILSGSASDFTGQFKLIDGKVTLAENVGFFGGKVMVEKGLLTASKVDLTSEMSIGSEGHVEFDKLTLASSASLNVDGQLNVRNDIITKDNSSLHVGSTGVLELSYGYLEEHGEALQSKVSGDAGASIRLYDLKKFVENNEIKKKDLDKITKAVLGEINLALDIGDIRVKTDEEKPVDNQGQLSLHALNEHYSANVQSDETKGLTITEVRDLNSLSNRAVAAAVVVTNKVTLGKDNSVTLAGHKDGDFSSLLSDGTQDAAVELSGTLKVGDEGTSGALGKIEMKDNAKFIVNKGSEIRVASLEAKTGENAVNTKGNLIVKEDSSVNELTVDQDSHVEFESELAANGEVNVNGVLVAEKLKADTLVRVGNESSSGKLVLSETTGGGIIFADPAWGNGHESSSVVIKNTKGFASKVVAGQNSYVIIGADESAASAFNQTGMKFGKDDVGAWAYVAQKLDLSDGGALMIDPKLTDAPTDTDVVGKTVTVNNNGLLILNTDVEDPVITAGKLEVAEGGRIFLANVKPSNKPKALIEVEGDLPMVSLQQNKSVDAGPLYEIALQSSAIENTNKKTLSFVSKFNTTALAAMNSLELSEALKDLNEKHADKIDSESDDAGIRALSRFNDEAAKDVGAAVHSLNTASTLAASAGVYNAQLDMDGVLGRVIRSHDERGLWADVLGGHTKAGSLFDGSGYKSDLYGAVLGVNVGLDDKTTLGAALSAGRTKAHTTDTPVRFDDKTNLVGMSLFAKHQEGDLLVRGELGFTAGSSKVKGSIFNDPVSEKIKSRAFTAAAGLEYAVALNDTLSVRPHADVRLTRLVVKGHAAPFETAKDTLNVVRLPVGVALEGRTDVNGWSLKPRADVTVSPSVGSRKAESRISLLGGSYSLKTNVVDRAPVSIGMGVKAARDAVTLGAGYTAELGSKGRRNHEVLFSASYAF